MPAGTLISPCPFLFVSRATLFAKGEVYLLERQTLPLLNSSLPLHLHLDLDSLSNMSPLLNLSVPVPGPPGLPILGNIKDLDPADSMASLSRLSDTYGRNTSHLVCKHQLITM